MKMIQKNLRDHVVLAGYGVSNSKALVELLARGHDPASIVVIDHNEENLVRASKCGVAVLQGDAGRNETLEAARLDRARALLVSAGRDDSNILVILTARKVAPNVNISVTIRESDNEDIARHAGADTVINPVSFSGLLLASSLEGPYRADYLADLASNEGSVILRERLVEAQEVGMSPAALCTGQAVRIIRNGGNLGPKDDGFAKLETGDRVLEIVDER